MYKPRKYPSKILLTGEYTVLLGYPAIAIPWSGRYAKWNDTGLELDNPLLNFYHFIKEHRDLKSSFLLDEFYSYIQNGGHLKSNIPFGYGLGSSGSFCAAVLDRFGIADFADGSHLPAAGMDFADEIRDKKDVELIYNLLKSMEDFFHGQSSGLDPMVSFYNCAVQICNGEISFPQIKSPDVLSKHQLYLVDSKLNRDTQHLVSSFKESIKDASYLSKLTNELVPLNNALIEALLNVDIELFAENWLNLSKTSMDVFHNMIPESFKSFWKTGIESKTYYCKLCGAGGGGLFLVKVMDEIEFGVQMKIYDYDIFH